MAQRRTRHRFLVNEGKRMDVLAYSKDRALAILETQGYWNIEYLPQQRKVRPASEATWRKDDRAIQEAVAMLGLRLPVTVKLTGHEGGRRGGYRPTEDGAGHRITIKNYLDPERAGRTLWHELAHAMQFEREIDGKLGRAALLKWAASDIHRGSYRSRPCEIEARSFEDYNDACPLTLPA